MKSRQKIRCGIILVSFFLFPALFFYFSPVLIIQAVSRGIINGSFIIFLILFLSALFLGRGFCGWLCPAAGCQEALFAARNKRIAGGNWFKWLLWIPWIMAIVIVTFRAGGLSRLDFFYMTENGLSVTSVHHLVIYYLVLLLLIVFPALTIGKRSFCHHLCWMAPFMILGRQTRNFFAWPSLQLHVEPERCIECNRCTAQCPMSIPVQEMVQASKISKRQTIEHQECILCGTCADVCKTKVISFEWSGK